MDLSIDQLHIASASQAQEGGSIPDHSECMKKKIELLMKEGKSQDQAVAIAYKHCGDEAQKSADIEKMGAIAEPVLGDDEQIAHERLVDEAQGAESYQRMSELAKDPDLKKLLQELAGEELGHSKKLTAWIEAHKPSEETEKSAPKSFTVDICKVADNVVYGIVLHANKPDLQGDIMSADDIRKAMHDFMAEFRTINKDHADDIDACPVECWQTDKAGKLGESEYGPGDWLMGTKINDPAMLAAVVEGKYKSYSIEGIGTRLPIAA
jgi:hypothetical protein